LDSSGHGSDGLGVGCAPEAAPILALSAKLCVICSISGFCAGLAAREDALAKGFDEVLEEENGLLPVEKGFVDIEEAVLPGDLNNVAPISTGDSLVGLLVS
jgi:hypothetical protein